MPKSSDKHSVVRLSALLLYGAGHLFRRVVSESIVTRLEPETRGFTVGTNGATELSALQPDVATWPVPSLTKIRGTVLGATGLATYLGPNAGGIPTGLAGVPGRLDALRRARPRHGALRRVSVATQLSSQCWPPSPENDCSKR